MKKRNIILLFIILLIVTIILILAVVRSNKKLSKPLYIYDYENYSWGHYTDGYIIYDDGGIGKYEKYIDVKSINKRPKQKITKEELTKLKKLADEVTDDYISEERFVGTDRGQSTSKIYNNALNKWVILSEGGSFSRTNKSEIANEIEKYTRMLKDKYLKNEE